jgi:hypothetical protein
MQKFKVNDLITLKLEGKDTIIYVAGERFRQCKHLFIDIPVDEIEKSSEIGSIDEAAENFKVSPETSLTIPSESRFWAHCSNLQTWAENSYDTRLLHSNLAFPLLKRLSDVGDGIALSIFKEEIAKRIESGYLPTIRYLWNEGYVKYLNQEEFSSIINPNSLKLKHLLDIEDIVNKRLYWAKDLSDLESEQTWFLMKGEKVSALEISYTPDLNKIPSPVLELKNLTFLRMIENSLSSVPKSIGTLKLLIHLDLRANKIGKIPSTLSECAKLKKLELSSNFIKSIPDSIGRLNSLEELDLHSNKLSLIPKSIGEISTLRKLNLSNNLLNFLPDSISNLYRLEDLNISYCNLKEIPDSVANLVKLENLLINGNKLNYVTEKLTVAKALKYLQLDYNQGRQIENLLIELEKKGVFIYKIK